jgi:uncharacterized membrane protein
MPLNISTHQHGMKKTHQQLDFPNKNQLMLQNISIPQHGMKNTHQQLDLPNKNQLMPHHTSMSQHGTKNSHLQLDSVLSKDHHSSINHHSTIICQPVQVLSKQKDQKVSENQHIVKEIHQQQDSFNFQFANKLELKVLHVLHQTKYYSL